MRTTVGPLPPAVYWRRRAVVLGALLLGVIVLFVSCSGGDSEARRTGGAATLPPTPAPAATTPVDEPSFIDAVPGGGPSLPDPGTLTSAPTDPDVDPSTDPGPADGQVAGTAPADGSCSDAEISVTPLPAAPTVKRGAAVEIRLKVKNISARTCSRDLGAKAQEVYLGQGAREFWSSDTCSTDRRSNVERLAAGAEREFRVTWNGRQSSRCTAALATGPAPAAGRYEVRGRVDTKISDPVVLTVVG